MILPNSKPHRTQIDASLAAAAQTQAVFTRLYPDSPRAAADLADAALAAGTEPAPLAGVAVSIKDLLDVAGEATTAGSTVLRDAEPATQDAPVVQRLRAAGAAIIGKTNMTEFAFSGIGLNPHYGTPANPADAEVARIPGGSSSGAAVSVALGICRAAIGSDTGGSIRIPAAFCGLVGFKSTARRVPTEGAIPLSTTLDTICAMARSVDDCILMDSVIADDRLTVPTLPLAGLRLALSANFMLDNLDAHVAASFSAALSRLSAAGAVIVETPFAPFGELATLNKFPAVEAYAWHRRLLAEHESEYDQRVSKRIKYGAAMSAADYIEMQGSRRVWIAAVERLLEPYDALIAPTVPMVAPPIAELEASEQQFVAANALVLRNTSAINFLDGCAISLPCHARGTLPVGLMLAGVAMNDAKLLAVAKAIEACLAGICD
jgi:Asp-tRNA(Asn)/Glu-tRNA(Gln) amidotransferase A subunit family amidase